MKAVLGAAFAVAALTIAAPANATLIPSGNLVVAMLFTPTVTINNTTHTFKANNGVTAEIAGSGGLSGAAGAYPTRSGHLNGTVAFSPTIGTTLAETLANFFVFSDGHGGNYSFSVSSVKTTGYNIRPGSSSFALYLVGTTLDANPNFTYAATSSALTLTFNKTGASGYSASGSLTVLPATPTNVTRGVPEPASWAMMLAGFGAIGGALRVNRRTKVAFI